MSTNESARLAVAFAREASMTKRCHTFPIVGDYTTGLHSYNALSLYLILCPVPTRAAIWEIQFHDSAERIVGDMPAPAKKLFRDLGRAYEDAEVDVLTKYGLHNPHSLSEEDRKWVNACDKLEFLLFCIDQHRMGNRNVVSREDTIIKSLETADLPKEAREFFRHLCMNGLPMIGDDAS